MTVARPQNQIPDVIYPKNILRIFSYIGLYCIVACGFIACGGSVNDFDLGFVEDVRVDPASVSVGDNATVMVEFEPNSFTEDESESVEDTEVVVLLPSGVDFVDGSSELDGSLFDGFEARPPNSVELCSDGSRALRYSFQSGELSTLGDNRIRLHAKAFEARGTVQFLAEVDEFFASPCGIEGNDSDDLIILP